jgi:hypothetical protein
VSDFVEEIHGINNFQIFFDKLYFLYHQSPKNQRELDEIVSSLGIRKLNIGRILSVRWAASTERSIDAVINNLLRSAIVSVKRLSTKV